MADRAGGSRRPAATEGVLAETIVGRWASVALEGELDLSNADRIPTVTQALAARGISECTIDLGPVTFLDASVLNALRAADRLLTEHGGRLLVVGMSPLATRALRATGLDRSLPAWTPDAARDDEAPAAEAAGARSEALEEAVATLTAPGDGGAVLTALFRRIARTAASTVPGCTAASCGLLALGTARTAAPSDPLAVELDVAQYEVGRGPCLRAIRTGQPSTLHASDADEGEGLVRHGIEGACSVPFRVAGQVVGSLNCYGTDERFSDEAAAPVEALAAAAGAALARALSGGRLPPRAGRP